MKSYINIVKLEKFETTDDYDVSWERSVQGAVVTLGYFYRVFIAYYPITKFIKQNFPPKLYFCARREE